jgi:O-antigen/teichoic acid export membrane protein
MSATLTQAAVNPHHRARNTAWNLLGMCAPMVVALFAIPLLVEGMGKERFGLLTMIWMLVGYLGLFDLGLGRALTQTVAQRLGEGRLLEVAGIFWTALGIMSLLGALGGLLAWNLAPWLAYSLLKVDPVLQSETLRSFRVVAFGLPILVSVTGLVGTLEAFQKFKLVNAIRIPTGIYTFVGPLLVLPYSSRLSSVVLALLFGRLVEWLIFFFACLNTIPGVLSPVAHGQRQMAGLFRFGSWMTVTNLISPLLMHVDRFLIGAVRAASEVAYFATPAEIVVKLLILPRAWVGVLFPSFAGGFRLRREETADLFLRASRYLLFGLFPVVALVVAVAPEFLTLWLDADFGTFSTPVMKLLAIGIFLHSLAYVPMSLLQASGRPDLTAKLNLIELPVYVVVSSLLIRHFGIVGAASAWLLRAGVDMYFSTRFALRIMDRPGACVRRLFWMITGNLVGLAMLALPLPVLLRLAGVILLSLAHIRISWRWLLEDGDRLRMTQHYAVAREKIFQLLSHFKSDTNPES